MTQPKTERGTTNFDEFSKSGGALLIKEHFRTPAPKARYGKLTFDIQRLSNPKTGRAAIALRIEFLDGDGLSWVDSVDDEEIPSLLAAAKECVEQRSTLANLLADYIEFIFSTRSGFGLGIYYDKKSGDSGEWIKVSGDSVFLRDMADLIVALERATVNIQRLRQIVGDHEADDDDSSPAVPRIGPAT